MSDDFLTVLQRLYDPDMDGLPTVDEERMGTSPFVYDSDFDGSPDGAEVRAGRNPAGYDAENGEVGGWDRVVLAANDADDDGVPDPTEAMVGTDARTADTDRDGIEDGLELTVPDLSPLRPDSDGDGYVDGRAPVPADNDLDGLTNAHEAELGTHPDVWDTDGDTIADGLEVERGTDPVAWLDQPDDESIDDVLERHQTDPDLDGLTNEVEAWYGTDPNAGDSDGGGVWDGRELVRGTDPTDAADDALAAVEAAADAMFDGP